MSRLPRAVVVAAWDAATSVRNLSRATREESQARRHAWTWWRARWRELSREAAGRRVLVVCVVCHRYRDGQEAWLPMPPGLDVTLLGAPGLCVSHSYCPVCTARALHEVRRSPSLAPASAGVA